MHKRHILFPVLGLCLVVLFTGCITKVPPAPDAGFLPPATLENNGYLPFQKSWQEPGLNWRRYASIYIAPVNTDYLIQMSWWDTFGRRHRIDRDMIFLREYTRLVFEEAFQEDPNYRYQVVTEPNSLSLILELALIEVVPNKAILETLSYAGGPLAQGAGILFGALVRRTSKSTVAFEARVKDGETKKIIALYADREGEKASLINVKGFSLYGHTKSILREWAKQFVQVLSRESWEGVPDSKPFELKPW